MNTKLKNATADFFEKCTPAERQTAFVMMTALISASHSLSSYTVETPTTGTTVPELLKLFEACPRKDRLTIVFFFITKWGDEWQDTIKMCQDDHKQMDSLPVSTLRNLAAYEQEKAHKSIVTAFPAAADLLISLECLTSFSTSTDEPTINDLQDVKESLVYVWGWEPAGVTMETEGKKA